LCKNRVFDLKHTNPTEHKKYTGASNRLILKNLCFLVDNNVHLIIRIPLIPGINSEENEIGKMIELLKTFEGKVKEVHLLPYHTLAKNKYKRFEKENRLINLQDLEKSQIHTIKMRFEAEGFIVKIGG
jgi:pyruvate formate lyase activating enzyme